MKSSESYIHISELRNIANAIFNHMENQLEIEQVSLGKDYYWCLSDDQRYNMLAEPEDHLVGQLFDDWDFIKPIADDPSLATPLCLVHLAPLLEYLATQVDWFGRR